MAEILKGMPPESNPNLLVGFNKADDAGVFRINEHQALVQTVDFFPPIVDDPYGFGQIAAANALSDIYAMGGTPLTALNIVAFPIKMAPEILQKVLLGGADKIREAGAVIVGGHSIKDTELKYGLACTGIIDVNRIITNAGARAGDRLFLTKPLGTGIVATAVKRNIATRDDAEMLTRQMARLNKTASELMVKHHAGAATDITGYGLLGHVFEVADASGVSIELIFGNLPIMPNAIKYAEAGALTGGADANFEYLNGKVRIAASLSKPQIDILYDPQTSGGLLIALGEKSYEPFRNEAHSVGLEMWEIGRVIPKADFAITIV